MKKIILAALVCLVPAWVFSQQGKLAEIELPDDKPAAEAGAVKPAPRAQAAEIIPVIEPSRKAAPAPAAKPAVQPAAKPAAAPAAPAAKPAVQPAAKLPAPKTAPAAAKISAPGTMPAGFRPGPLVVLPKEELAWGGFRVIKRHKVVKGDTLWDLSAAYYKDPFMWGRIYNANFSSVANPDLIYPKDELIIPDITEVLIPYRQPVAAESGDNGDEYAYARPAPAPARRRAIPPGEALPAYDAYGLSEEMPKDQTEWKNAASVVSDSWQGDGVITALTKPADDFFGDGLSLEGETLEISMSGSVRVRPGDYLSIYLRGTDAYDSEGNRLGLEVQQAGLAEVLSVDGAGVKARIIEATTAILKGYIVKKR